MKRSFDWDDFGHYTAIALFGLMFLALAVVLVIVLVQAALTIPGFFIGLLAVLGAVLGCLTFGVLMARKAR